MNGREDGHVEQSVRRSRVLVLLDERETPVTVDQLVDELVRDIDRLPDATRDDAAWERLHEQLYEEDLAELDRVGLVTFEKERGLVGPSTSDGTTESTVDAAVPPSARIASDERERTTGTTWLGRYALVLAVLSTVLLAAMALGVEPVSSLQESTLSTAMLVFVTLLSFVIAVRR